MLGCRVIVRVPVPLVAMQAAPNVGDTSPLPRISIVPLKVLSGFVVSVKEAETPTGPLPTSGASNAPIQVPRQIGKPGCRKVAIRVGGAETPLCATAC